MKCDKCKAKTAVRYQLGEKWICWNCLPREVLKRYPLSKKHERPAPEAKEQT